MAPFFIAAIRPSHGQLLDGCMGFQSSSNAVYISLIYHGYFYFSKCGYSGEIRVPTATPFFLSFTQQSFDAMHIYYWAVRSALESQVHAQTQIFHSAG